PTSSRRTTQRCTSPRARPRASRERIKMDTEIFVAVALGVAVGLSQHGLVESLVQAVPHLFPNWGKRRLTYTPEAVHGTGGYDPAPFEGPVRKHGFTLPLVWIYPTKTVDSRSRWHIYLGGDEYERRTLVIPVPFVGQVVIALWRGGTDD